MLMFRLLSSLDLLAASCLMHGDTSMSVVECDFVRWKREKSLGARGNT